MKSVLNRKFSRRRLLTTKVPQSLFLLAGPWVKLAQAQSTNVKPHYISLFTPIGQMPEWLPEGSSTDFKFTGISEPLERHKDKIIVLDGIDSVVGSHKTGSMGMFTGTTFASGNKTNYKKAKGPSIHNFLADQIGGRLINAGINTKSGSQGWMSFRADGSVQTQNNNVGAVFDTVFAGVKSGSGGGTVDTAAIAEANLLRAKQRSILDAWSQDINQIKRYLGAEQKIQLENHISSIREVESLIQPLDETAQPKGASCEVPDKANANTGNSDYKNHGVLGNQVGTILAAGLGCDSIQFASMMWSYGGAPGINFGALTKSKDNFHALTHAASPVDVVKVSSSVAESDVALRKIYGWYSERIAEFFDKLDAIPYGSGTLLDHTVVTWGSDCGHYRSHAHNNRRIIVAGNFNNRLQSKRFYSLDNTKRVGHIHTEVARVMGLNVDKFGEDSGGFPELRA